MAIDQGAFVQPAARASASVAKQRSPFPGLILTLA